MMRPDTISMRRGYACAERGVVLIIVLWLVALMALAAAAFSYSSRTETRLLAGSVERASARALAEAGIYYAVSRVMVPVPDGAQIPIDGGQRTWRFGNGKVVFSVQDASGRVDLNRGDREALLQLLRSTGMDDTQAQTLVDAIEDYRDEDDLPRVNGAEIGAYRAAGLDYGPKNAAFSTVDELQQVLGVSDALYGQLASHLTTVSGTNMVNGEAASADLLRRLMPEVPPEAIDEYVAARRLAAENGQPAPPFPFQSPYLSQRKGLVYHVAAEATLDGGAVAYIEADILAGGRIGSLQMLNWREGRL